MAQHDHHRALDALRVEGEDARSHDRHMRDRGIGDELLHVALHQRDERGVDHRDHRQHEDEPGELRAGFGEHRQAEADETVTAELEQHAREDDRPGGRGLHVGIGQPGMHRPHRHLDREAGKEGEPQPGLRLRGEIVVQQRRDVGRARFVHHPHHRDQHQHRAKQRVEEELIRRVDTVIAAPYADDQIHRDQAGFEEDIEQEHVLCGKHADHQHFHEQEGAHVFADPLADRIPAREDADRHQEHAEHDQHQCDPVDPQRIAEARENLRAFGELPLRPADIVIEPQQHAEREIYQRGHQCDHARGVRPEEQAGNCAGQRHGEHQRKDGKFHQNSTQVIAATSPRSITSA